MSTRHRKILVILHLATSSPGRIGQWLERKGCVLDARLPVLGQELPRELDAYHGIVVFGGPGSVNDNCDHYIEVMRWLERPLRARKPYIGICLGGQMLAKVLGAKVAPHAQGLWEVGYYPVRPTTAGRRLWDCWPERVYQWHAEGFDVPTGAELLLEGLGHFPNQAFLHAGHAFGLQFHPEVTTAMLHNWTVRSAETLKKPGARARHTHFAERLQYDPAMACWLDTFLDHWLELPAHPARAPAPTRTDKTQPAR